MKSRTLAALLSVVILIQVCGSMAIVKIPQPGESRSSCGGVCTTTDRNKAAVLNTLAWTRTVYALLILVVMLLVASIDEPSTPPEDIVILPPEE